MCIRDRLSNMPGSSGHWAGGPLEIRTSGSQFKFSRPIYQTNNFRALLQYALALLNREPTETVEYWGTIVSIGESEMTLKVIGHPEGLYSVLVEEWDGLTRYRRIKDEPFLTIAVGEYLPDDWDTPQ